MARTLELTMLPAVPGVAWPGYAAAPDMLCSRRFQAELPLSIAADWCGQHAGSLRTLKQAAAAIRGWGCSRTWPPSASPASTRANLECDPAGRLAIHYPEEAPTHRGAGLPPLCEGRAGPTGDWGTGRQLMTWVSSRRGCRRCMIVPALRSGASPGLQLSPAASLRFL